VYPWITSFLSTPRPLSVTANELPFCFLLHHGLHKGLDGLSLSLSLSFSRSLAVFAALASRYYQNAAAGRGCSFISAERRNPKRIARYACTPCWRTYAGACARFVTGNPLCQLRKQSLAFISAGEPLRRAI